MSPPGIALSPDGATLAVTYPEWQTALVWDLSRLPGLLSASPPATTRAAE